ncbi:methyltransferase domain-containing protein [Candidatus Pseudothioglobus singularis]|nr:methyltransferase domain-containing protein [Candidatus Pseudothioglobus singularis]
MNYESLNKHGIALLEKNQFNEAKLFFEKAIELKSDFSDAINNLGLLEHKIGKLDQAIRMYKKVVAIDSNYALESENKILSVIYFFSHGNIQEALATLKMLVEKNPRDALLFNMLGGCFASIGNSEMAILNYQKALELDSEYAIPKHMLNSLTGHTSKAPPKQYVKNLFDDYAHRFNDALVNNLQYSLPFIIKELILQSNSEKSEYQNVVDLGCGTGLAGKDLRDLSSNLIGVDISENMISEAEKLDVYDTLIIGDIVKRLNEFPDKFDLLIALDVLIYIGDVQSTFKAVHSSCKKDSLFVFSVEIQSENGYSLLKSSRYAHSDEYIMDQSAELFKLLNSQNVRIRKEGENWIQGKIYVFRPI